MRIELIQTVLKTVMLTDTSILFHLLFSICKLYLIILHHYITLLHYLNTINKRIYTIYTIYYYFDNLVMAKHLYCLIINYINTTIYMKETNNITRIFYIKTTISYKVIHKLFI